MYELTDINCMTEYQLNKEFEANIQEAEEWTNRGYWECDRILWETQCEYDKFMSIQHEGIVGDFFKFVWWIIKKAIQLIVNIFKFIFKLVSYVIKAIAWVFGGDSSSSLIANKVQTVNVISLVNNNPSIKTIKISGENRKKKIGTAYSREIKNFSKASNDHVKSEKRDLEKIKNDLRKTPKSEAYQFFNEKGRILTGLNSTHRSIDPSLIQAKTQYERIRDLNKEDEQRYAEEDPNFTNIQKAISSISDEEFEKANTLEGKLDLLLRLNKEYGITPEQMQRYSVYASNKAEEKYMSMYNMEISPELLEVNGKTHTLYGQDIVDNAEKTFIYNFNEQKYIQLLASENIVEAYNMMVKNAIQGLIHKVDADYEKHKSLNSYDDLGKIQRQMKKDPQFKEKVFKAIDDVFDESSDFTSEMVTAITALKDGPHLSDDEIIAWITKQPGYYTKARDERTIKTLIKLRVNYNKKLRNLMSAMIKLNYKQFGLSVAEASKMEADIKKSALGVKGLFLRIFKNKKKFIKGNGYVDFRSIGGGQFWTNPGDAVLDMVYDNLPSIYALSLQYKYIVLNHGDSKSPNGPWTFAPLSINVLGRQCSTQDEVLEVIMDDIEKNYRKGGNRRPVGVYLMSCNPAGASLQPATQERIKDLNVIVRMAENYDSFSMMSLNNISKSMIDMENKDKINDDFYTQRYSSNTGGNALL